MTVDLSHGLGRFRCYKNNKHLEVALSKGTFFEDVHIPLTTALRFFGFLGGGNALLLFSIMYSFSRDDSYENCRHEAADFDDDERLSQGTIADWCVSYHVLVLPRNNF